MHEKIKYQTLDFNFFS